MRASGGRLIDRPRNSIEPAEGTSTFEIRLNIVVLPAPFGPIRATMAPASTVKLTSLLATKASNDL